MSHLSGIGRDFQNAWNGIYPILDQFTTLLVAPNFYLPTDSPRMINGVYSNWYDPSKNLAWGSFEGNGQAAGVACSTYDVYDSIFAAFRNNEAYPNLQTVYFAGHSGGGAFVSRYSAVMDDAPNDVKVKFVSANSPSFPYFTAERPDAPGNCAGYNSWMYGWDGGLTRYVQSRVGNMSATDVFK